MNFKDIETGCKHYWSIINGPTNSWNQSIYPLTGVQSHVVLGWLYDQFGRDEVQKEIERIRLKK